MRMFQDNIESGLDKRGGKSFGPPNGMKRTIFMDDLSMPLVNDWGDQVREEGRGTTRGVVCGLWCMLCAMCCEVCGVYGVVLCSTVWYCVVLCGTVSYCVLI